MYKNPEKRSIDRCQITQYKNLMNLNEKEQAFWNEYLESLDEKPFRPYVSANIAGNEKIANGLLELFLCGKKNAASGLAKDYQARDEKAPEEGDYWIILDQDKTPRAIVKTVRIEYHLFKEVTEEIAVAEGEGDLSLKTWQDLHREFFTPYLEELKIADLNNAMVVTEFFELVWPK